MRGKRGIGLFLGGRLSGIGRWICLPSNCPWWKNRKPGRVAISIASTRTRSRPKVATLRGSS